MHDNLGTTLEQYCPQLWFLGSFVGTKVFAFLGGSPLFSKAPPNLSLQKVSWHPPKGDWRPPICNFYKELHRNLPSQNLHFGGCQFAFWRLKFLGVLDRKEGTPQKGGTLGFPPCLRKTPFQPSSSNLKLCTSIVQRGSSSLTTN